MSHKILMGRYDMERRDLLKAAAAITAGGVLGGSRVLSHSAQAGNTGTGAGRQPNILFILVDELRFPSVFPSGISTIDEFLARFMPNTYTLWQKGVKFAGHYTAASACSPARGTLVTGLYSQQTWLLQTITSAPSARFTPTPTLKPEFPTYGKLLRDAGYQTPYIGKWHLSIPQQNAGKLEPYGFDFMTFPDPTGANLQGTVGDEANGYHNDMDISNQAVQWLGGRRRGDAPWCLTVSFVNPHDQQFFWAGTEFQTYDALFQGNPLQPFTLYSTPDNPPLVAWDADPLKDPPPLGYPALPPNWQSAADIQRNKPSTQTFAQTFQAAVWGGISQDAGQTDFTVEPYPGLSGTGIGVAPYSYWQRILDSYTQIMGIVDQRIGEVLAALPPDVAEDTVIVFASDHGEYGGAHGFVAGKVGSVYEEAYHVPLIVVDPTGRFTGDIGTVRTELTSHVDLLPLFVSLGHGGSRDWLTGSLAQIYGGRLDLLPLLRSGSAPGRPYILLATDEQAPGFLVGGLPFHLLGLRTQDYKLGVYSNWKDG